MIITTNAKGQLAVSKAELRALELGYLPSRPLYDTRYDLIIDDFKSLKRMQVKYANGKSSRSIGAVVVALSYADRRRNVFTYKQEEVDGLIVYIPKTDRLCLFPPEVFIGKKALCIRLEGAKNKQKRGIILAEDYYW